MKEFQVKTYSAIIGPHHNADRIELCNIGDYQSVVPKGTLKDGDVVAYIPEGSIVPDDIIAQLGLTGKLAGKKANRVKAIKLRGVLSQGLILPMLDRKVGEDVTEELNITKYEPPIPDELKGKILGAMHGKTLRYPVRNIKLHPNELKEGETVVITEKIHGSFCCVGFYKNDPIVTSKGLGKQGLVLDPFDDNIYSKVYQEIKPTLDVLHNKWDIFYVLGEIYGYKIQDLQYGLKEQKEQRFRVFDIFVGEPNLGTYLELGEMLYNLTIGGQQIDYAPILEIGPYSKEKLLEFTSGESKLGGNKREGVVIKASPERLDSEHERAQYKSISEAHILRKGGTEYN